MTEKEYIKMIGEYAIKVYPSKKILPSLVIAQCILETGHFKSGLFTKAYNLTGTKWVKGCGYDYIEMNTTEYINGKATTVKAKFRKYKTLEDGIDGHYVFLGYSRYNNLKGITDYKKACTLVREDGWATDPKYTDLLISIIQSNNLTEWDKKITVKYFNKYIGKSDSLVTGLIAVGAKSDKQYRTKIAKANGINNYSYTASQNTKMLELLKKGKLIKP